MDFLDKTYDRASCEIEDILQHQKFDKSDVEMLGELIDIVKDIEMVYGYQDGSQMDNGNYMRGRSGRMMPYGRGMYMRGRSMTGTYSRDDNKDMMINHLQEVADMAIDDKDRKAVERLISQMDSRM